RTNPIAVKLASGFGVPTRPVEFGGVKMMTRGVMAEVKCVTSEVECPVRTNAGLPLRPLALLPAWNASPTSCCSATTLAIAGCVALAQNALAPAPPSLRAHRASCCAWPVLKPSVAESGSVTAFRGSEVPLPVPLPLPLPSLLPPVLPLPSPGDPLPESRLPTHDIATRQLAIAKRSVVFVIAHARIQWRCHFARCRPVPVSRDFAAGWGPAAGVGEGTRLRPPERTSRAEVTAMFPRAGETRPGKHGTCRVGRAAPRRAMEIEQRPGRGAWRPPRRGECAAVDGRG